MSDSPVLALSQTKSYGLAIRCCQFDVVKRLWRLGEAWSNKPVVTASEMGRTAAKQEGFEDVLVELDNLAKQCRAKDHRYMCPKTKKLLSRPSCKRGSLIGRLHKPDLTGAMNVVASRIRMSGRPTFDPRPFLSDEIKQLYDHPLKDAETMIQEGVSPPRVLFHASFREKIAVLELLERSGRLGFRSIHSVYEKYGNGLFSVPKDLDVDRLILDARPPNLLQCTPNRFRMSMASSYTLLGMHLEPSEKLLMSGDPIFSTLSMLAKNVLPRIFWSGVYLCTQLVTWNLFHPNFKIINMCTPV